MAQGSARLAAVVAGPGELPPGGHAPDLPLNGLVLLAQFHGIAADAQQLAHQFGRSGEPFDETTLLLAAKHLGLKAKVSLQPASRIGMANLPALAIGEAGDSFIVAKASNDAILIHDLVEKRPRSLSKEEFESR